MAAAVAGGSVVPAAPVERRAYRAAWLEALAVLRRRYEARWIPAALAEAVRRVDVDREAGVATIELRGGRRLVDSGSALSLVGGIDGVAVRALAAACTVKGWTAVRVSGSDQFRRAVYVALSIIEPPVKILNYQPPEDVRRTAEAVLTTRAGIQSTTPPARPTRPAAPPGAAAWMAYSAGLAASPMRRPSAFALPASAAAEPGGDG